MQLGARWYWPEVGRFLQQDPVGDGINWYEYAESNPLAWIDPGGEILETPWDVANAIWSVGDFIAAPGWWTGAAAAYDVAAVFAPGLPGGAGAAAKAAGKASGAAKACGRLGGQAHRAKVAKTAGELDKAGWDVVAGGRIKPERRVGVGSGRHGYPDIIAEKGGKQIYCNIGRATKGGRPVARERDALKDLGAINRTFFIPF